MIGIIDYGSGNLRSVYNAFRYLKQDVKVCEDPDEMKGFDKIVLPGVGSSSGAMDGLSRRRLVEPLVAHIKKGKPFLGICLGLQLLFTRSEECGGCECLDVIRGEVKAFPREMGLKVPQIGWNTVRLLRDDCPIFRGLKDGSYFYFVHSYYCAAEQRDLVAAETEYGIPYTSAIWKDNIYAVQFHPERSQANGIKMLENFTDL